MKKTAKILVLTASLMTLSSSAYANLSMTYYTYNGFDDVLSAWQLAAMIFVNVDYKSLFALFMIMGMLFGAAAVAYKLFMQRAGDPLGWIWPALVGFILYLGVFSSKGTITVYDSVLNKTQVVSGIPDGVILIACSLNMLEHGFVEMINISNPPLSYKEAAGGIGFDSLNKISTTTAGSLDDGYIGPSTEHYIQDCVLFELSRPGTTLSMSSFLSGDDLLSAFGQAANPAVYTMWFADSDGYRTGVPERCDEAFSNIQSYYNDNAITDKWLTANCGKLGFNTSDAMQLNQCKQIVQDSVLYATGSGVSSNKFMQQAALSAYLNNVAVNGGVEDSIKAVGNSSVMSAISGTGIMINEYMPIIKAIATGVAIAFVPFTVLFIATPIVGKSLKMTLGFFVFLTAWGVADALTHGFATSRAYQFFQEARDNNIGYASIMAMPSAAAKSVGLFGLIRIVAAVIAGKLSTILVGFGSEMASMVGNLSGQVQSAGAGAGKMATQEGTAAATREYTGSMATMENAHSWSFDERSSAQAMQESSRIAQSAETQTIMGGSSVDAGRRMGAAGAIGDSRRAFETEESAAAMGGGGLLARAGAQVGASRDVGNIESTARNAKAFFGDDSMQSMVSMQKLEQHGLLDDRSAAAANRALGMEGGKGPFHAGMKVNHHDWGATDDGKLMMLGASYQDGSGSFRVHDGMVNESRAMTGRQLLDKADQMEKMGHFETANAMRGLVRPDVMSSDGRHHGAAPHGRGIREDEAATFMETKSFDGRTAKVGVEHGSNVSWYDTSSDRQGRTIDHGDHVRVGNSIDRGDHVRVGNTVDRGDHTSIGNTMKLDEGTHLTPQTAAQMALDGNSLLVSQISQSGLSETQRDTQRLAVAASVSDGMGAIISRKGISEDHSGVDGSASGHIGIPGTKIGIGGSVSAGASATDQYQSSLMAQHYNEVMMSAEKEAQSKGLNKAEADKYVAGQLQGAVQEEKRYFEEHGKWSYGALAAADRGKKAWNHRNDIDLSKGEADGVKG